MRTRRLTIGVLGLALAAPAAAFADADTLPESVTGGGHVAATTFSVAVRAGANGENPVGTLTTSGFYNFTATATCVNVAGKTAVTGYRITTPPDEGRGFLASGRDMGLGHPAEIYYSGTLETPPTSCPAPSEPPPTFIIAGGGGTMDRGEFVVDGGPPELAPPWTPTGTPPGPSIFEPYTDPIQLLPEQSLTPLRLGQSQAQVGGVLARKALLIHPAFDRRGHVARLTSSARRLTLYGHHLHHGYTGLRPLLLARGWRLTGHGTTRVARRTTRRGTSTVEWKRGALVRATVARR